MANEQQQKSNKFTISSSNENHQLNNLDQIDSSDDQNNLNEFKTQSFSSSLNHHYHRKIDKTFVKFKSSINHQIEYSDEMNHNVNNFHSSDDQNSNKKINFHQTDDFDDYTNYRKSNEPFNQLRNPNQLVLIANYTEYSYPTFVLSLVNMNLSQLNLNKLSSIDTLHLDIYSSNPKGRSSKISLDFNIGNQTSQLKNLFTKTNSKELSKFFRFDCTNSRASVLKKLSINFFYSNYEYSFHQHHRI